MAINISLYYRTSGHPWLPSSPFPSFPLACLLPFPLFLRFLLAINKCYYLLSCPSLSPSRKLYVKLIFAKVVQVNEASLLFAQRNLPTVGMQKRQDSEGFCGVKN